jgi:hypothetical protein
MYKTFYEDRKGDQEFVTEINYGLRGQNNFEIRVFTDSEISEFYNPVR